MDRVAVVFIHGLRGNTDTWVNDDGKSLQELLREDDAVIAEYCDFFEYNYFSKITEFMNGFVSKHSFGLLSKLPIFGSLEILSKSKKVRKNKTIGHLASGLESELRARFDDHREIILIGHSMGGLVAKSLILSQLKSGTVDNIKSYISLATPHHGSLQALFLSFSKNKHITELQPLNEQTMNLEKEWSKNKSYLPKSRYLVSLDDEVVLPHCAVPNSADEADVFKVNDEDHTSICKPASKNSTSFILIRDFVKERLSGVVIEKDFKDSKIDKLKSYEKELFVIKLIIADVNASLIKSSKESYFKAEIACRLNKRSVDRLNELYDKIKFIYQNEFYLYDENKIDSSELVYKVHSEIKDKDSTILESAIESVSFLEKIGMLHQLANMVDQEVVWCNKDISEAHDGV
ncbi:TPA: ABC-three component system protein [Vibrio parahaemolyticus]